MKSLTIFEKTIIRLILRGDSSEMVYLRKQIPYLRIVDNDFTNNLKSIKLDFIGKPNFILPLSKCVEEFGAITNKELFFEGKVALSSIEKFKVYFKVRINQQYIITHLEIKGLLRGNSIFNIENNFYFEDENGVFINTNLVLKEQLDNLSPFEEKILKLSLKGDSDNIKCFRNQIPYLKVSEREIYHNFGFIRFFYTRDTDFLLPNIVHPRESSMDENYPLAVNAEVKGIIDFPISFLVDYNKFGVITEFEIVTYTAGDLPDNTEDYINFTYDNGEPIDINSVLK